MHPPFVNRDYGLHTVFGLFHKVFQARWLSYPSSSACAVSNFFGSIELVPSLEANVDMVLDDRTLCVVCV